MSIGKRKKKCDVLVVGAGTAGSIAAIAAARSGSKVILADKNGFLGGVLSHHLYFVPFAFHNEKKEITNGGLIVELIERATSIGGATLVDHPSGTTYGSYSAEHIKMTLLEMALEANVDLLLYSYFIEPIMENKTVKGARFINKSGIDEIEAKITIDATGDADVSARAGAPFEIGREGDGKINPPTLQFRLGNVEFDEIRIYMKNHREQFLKVDPYNMPLVWAYLGEFNSEFKTAIEKGDVPNSGDLLFRGIQHFNSTGNPGEVAVTFLIYRGDDGEYSFDGTNIDHMIRATIAMQQDLLKTVKFFQKYIPGFSNCYLIDTPPEISVRETRRIIGEYMLTEEDVLESKRFDDVVARCTTGISWDHIAYDSPPEGTHWYKRGKEGFHQVPYRCLVPLDVENILVAGRCISVSHVVHAGWRVIPNCMATGQAAGVSAHISAQKNLSPRKCDVSEIQNSLRKQKVLI